MSIKQKYSYTENLRHIENYSSMLTQIICKQV